MNKWKAVWNKRAISDQEIDLGTLIKLDGFDTGAGRIDVADWRAYVERIVKKLGIKECDTVFEIGCGSGAFLFALRERVLSVGGIDYGTGLIAAAKHAMPDGEFMLMEAKELEPLPQYDYVVANSVFHYFGLEYAAEVLKRMINKAKKAIAVMDIPDRATKVESETLRRDVMSLKEYDEKYKGLEHNYYARSWFVKQAEIFGLTDYKIFDGCIPNYAQNLFRFGCIIRK